MDYRDPLLRVSQSCSHSVCWEWGHLRLGVLFQTHQIVCDYSNGEETGATQPQSKCWSKDADYKVS